MQAEYTVLTATQVQDDDPQFRAFVDRSILSEFHQAIGRLRAHRRIETPLEIVLLSDFDLDCPTQKINASAITLNASTKQERFILAVREAAQQIKSTGAKLTQQAIAKLIPYNQQYVSRHWKLLQTLLDVPNSNSGKNPEPESSEVIPALVGVLESVPSACESAAQVLDTVCEVFHDWLDPVQWAGVWTQLSGRTQTAILSALTLTLPPAQIESLMQHTQG